MSHRRGWFFKLLYRRRVSIAIATGCLGIGMLAVLFMPIWFWVFIVAVCLIGYAWRCWWP